MTIPSAKKKEYVVMSPPMDTSGHRAGCYQCHDGAMAWGGKKASQQARKHTRETGHDTWVEYISHKVFRAF